MMHFNKAQNDRKLLVKKIEELTGAKAKYLFMPTYSYQIGDYTVTKEGDLETETPDMNLIRQLAEDGLITYEEENEMTEEETVIDEEPTVEETPAEEPATTEESTNTEESAVTDESITEEENEEPAKPETAEEAPITNDPTEPYIINISFSMEQHTGVSLRNLLNLIHSRGALLTKATGREFYVEDDLIEKLKDDACTESVEKLMRVIADYEDENSIGLSGITMTPERLNFPGLSYTDAEHADAFMKLASLMNAQALTQKRIQPKVVTEENEKYALRIWLIRIGMKGDEYKNARRILMENLSGHTAFRTEADAEKAKQKLIEKRRLAKAEASQGETTDAAEPLAAENESPTQGDVEAYGETA